MSIIGILTGATFGPWRMPQRAQNMIMNQYAAKKDAQIEYVIAEGLFYHFYPRTRMALQFRDISELFFTSAYQIPVEGDAADMFAETFKKKIIHFSLEGISGVGGEIIDSLTKELKVFHNNESLMGELSNRPYSAFKEHHV